VGVAMGEQCMGLRAAVRGLEVLWELPCASSGIGVGASGVHG
jgi:hypothetical protein